MTFSFGPRMAQPTEEDYITEEMLYDLSSRYEEEIEGFSLKETVGSGTAGRAPCMPASVRWASMRSVWKIRTLHCWQAVCSPKGISRKAERWRWLRICWLNRCLKTTTPEPSERRWMCCLMTGITVTRLWASMNTRRPIWDFPAVRMRIRRRLFTCPFRPPEIRSTTPRVTVSSRS